MRLRGPFWVMAAIGTAVGIGYLLSASPDQRTVIATAKAAHQPASTFTTPAAVPAPPVPSSVKTRPDDAVRFMFAQVASRYEASTRYPRYSIPLSAEQAEAYAGNHYEPVVLPLAGEGRFSVSLEKYRFTRGEDILVVATLNGTMVVGDQATARLESQDGDDSGSSTLERTPDGFFEGMLESDHEPGEYRLIVEARIDGKPIRHVSTLTIEPYLGDFGGVESPFIENNNLVIPVRFKPDASGYFALSANLYVGERPVAHLSHEQRLDGSSATIDLKAHGTVLAGQPDAPVMQLKGLQIRRLPARPGDRTDYAFGPEEGFEFKASGLDDLKDTPARDPESVQRAALLRKLAVGG
ncbi:hypothetical protein [Marinobacter sp. V034]|uniref:hypothetical protein n=1 Tax=Marinobacter sp. V034 TaxID=3459610 RepID=UPI004043E68C